jgi:anti-sigma B factor antagonist
MRFVGDISSASKESVLGAWQGLSGNGPVLLDFTKVEYINSSGIGLIITILMEADKTGQKVAVFGLTPHFQKVFTMVGIGKYAGLHKDEQTAVASL